MQWKETQKIFLALILFQKTCPDQSLRFKNMQAGEKKKKKSAAAVFKSLKNSGLKS